MNIKQNVFFLFLSILFTVGLFSCGPKALYRSEAALPENGWHKDSMAVFNFPINNTSVPYQLLLQLDYTTDYTNSNLWFFVTTTSPSGQQQRDTVNIPLFEHSGQPLGKSSLFGETIEHAIILKQAVGFRESGNYTLTLEQGMRRDVINGIQNIELILTETTIETPQNQTDNGTKE